MDPAIQGIDAQVMQEALALSQSQNQMESNDNFSVEGGRVANINQSIHNQNISNKRSRDDDVSITNDSVVASK